MIEKDLYFNCVECRKIVYFPNEDCMGEHCLTCYWSKREIVDADDYEDNKEWYEIRLEKTREMMVNALIETDIAMIENSYIHGDREFLWAILSGDGWIPYNQLTDEQVRETYVEVFNMGEVE